MLWTVIFHLILTILGSDTVESAAECFGDLPTGSLGVIWSAPEVETIVGSFNELLLEASITFTLLIISTDGTTEVVEELPCR